MFCPQCKAEYRQGFTRCADCDVELVYERPASASGSGEAGGHAENPDDPFCSFWRGDDPRIHAELCELLNEEGIPHKTVRREDHLFNLNIKNAFEIGIPFSQFEKAEAAIKSAYGNESEQLDVSRLLPYEMGYAAELGGAFPWQPLTKGYARTLLGQVEEPGSELAAAPEELDSDEQEENILTDWDPANWNPEHATVQVWSGEHAYPGEMTQMALRENQIHVRFDTTRGRCAIFVQPEDEARAREIVREIVEGAPPE
jgi:hypothetical protein